MKKNQFESELRRWQVLHGMLRPNMVSKLNVKVDEKRRAWLTKEVHLKDTPPSKGKWFSDGSVKDNVTLTSNEGYYVQREDGVVLKSLDTGHKLSDLMESTSIGASKLYLSKENQSINYSAPWRHMRILPSKMFPSSKGLVGAHGWELSAGTYMFVICEDGAIRYFPNDDSLSEKKIDGKHYVQHLPHAALAEHGAVLAAGNIGVGSGGMLLWASSNSGHYRVNDAMCRQNMVEALALHGYRYQALQAKSFYEEEHLSIQMLDLEEMEKGWPFWFFSYKASCAFQKHQKMDMPVCKGERPPRNDVVDEIKETLRTISEKRLEHKSEEGYELQEFC